MPTLYKMPRPDGSSIYVNPDHVSHTEPVDERSSKIHFSCGKEETVKLHQDDLAGRLCK